MDSMLVDPIIEYSHMIGKNTAEFTANDMAKFTKWWMKQPIREDLYDMAKKKKQVVKKTEVKKAINQQKGNKTMAGRVESVTISKKDVATLKVKDLKITGTQGGRIVGKKGTVVSGSGKTFEKFQAKKEEQRQRQVKALPVPVDVDQIDESVVDDLQDDFRNSTWKSAKAQTEERDDVMVDDPEEMTEEDIEEFIEENMDEEEEESVESNEVDEQERVLEQAGEEIQDEEGPQEFPPDGEEVCKMGLTALDVEALKYVLVEAVRVSSEGVFDIPEEYLLTVESILDGLNQ